ncbi:MAG TPA: BON domain-containing protein [Thermoanaerobaculia bacterium]
MRLARAVLCTSIGMSNTTPDRTKVLAAAAILLAGFAAGCGSSAYARRTDQDQLLSARVDERLAATSSLAGSRVEAKSHWGVVALLGEVPEEQLKREAEQVATTVPGVVRVNNLILVAKEASRAGGSAPPEGSLTIARAD